MNCQQYADLWENSWISILSNWPSWALRRGKVKCEYFIPIELADVVALMGHGCGHLEPKLHPG